MLSVEIKQVADWLKAANPIFENVEYYDEFVDTDEESDGRKGFTNEFLNYAYVRKLTDRNGINYVFNDADDAHGCNAKNVEIILFLICDFQRSVDRNSAAKILWSQLESYNSDGLQIEVLSIADESDAIYDVETGQKWKDADSWLLKIEFRVQKIIKKNFVSQISICKETGSL